MPTWEPKFMLAEDASGLGGGGEDDLQFEDTPSRGVTLEVVEEEEPKEIVGKDRLALLKEMQEKEAEFLKQKAALEAQVSPVAALQSSFANLAEKLEKATNRPVQQPMPIQRPQETAEQFKERIRNDFLVDPVGSIAEVGERMYGPALAQQAATISALSKQLLMQSPEKKVIFERYGQEIEQLAATAPGNPNAIFEATEIIASRHMTDIVSEQAKALAAQMFEEMKTKAGVVEPAVAATRGVHVETALPKVPRRDAVGRRVVQVTPTKMAEIKAEANRRHMTVEQYTELYVDTEWQKEYKDA